MSGSVLPMLCFIVSACCMPSSWLFAFVTCFLLLLLLLFGQYVGVHVRIVQ